MERLKVVERGETTSALFLDKKENPDYLEDFKAVARNLTENALKIVNRISANEMSKPEPKAELVEDYYLLFHYLDFIKQLVSSKM
jgi:hypothetical protein